jgi:hypothetical protein
MISFSNEAVERMAAGAAARRFPTRLAAAIAHFLRSPLIE